MEAEESVDGPRRAARECFEALLEGRGGWEPGLDRLAEEALGDDGAARVLFEQVVEALADRFEPSCVEAYRRVFLRILEICRRAEGFDFLDERLGQLGFPGGRGLAERARRLAGRAAHPRDVRRVAVLSRVTLGADAALSSVLLAHAKRRFPEAEIVLLGSRKAGELFAGDARVRLEELDYPRRGGLTARLAAWREASERLAAMGEDGLLVLDPDSRWSQAGMLPLTPNDRGYVFFESRGYRPDSTASLAELIAEWALDTLGGDRAAAPYLAPAGERTGASARRATVNFGVGGNETKRVADPFEAEAVSALLRRGYRVTLDRGFGPAEARRAEAAAEAARSRGLGDALELWQGTAAELAARIRDSELYVGYDSAGGHMAAALGVRGIDVFAGAPTERMRRRWSPPGAEVIAVAAGESALSVLERLEGVLG